MPSDIKIAPFEHTPVGDIPKKLAEIRQTYNSHKTRDVEWRLKQLRKLWWGLQDFTEKFQASLMQDLHKPPLDAILSEVGYCNMDLSNAIKNLKTWVKDDKDLDYPLQFSPMKPRIKKEPVGNTLVIGPYNFPLMLTIGPLIGVISAGCTAIIKPSESAPATAMVVQELVEKYLDNSAFKVVQGAVPETTALLDEKWDKIFYTGSPNVARIIYKAAAKNLTPVVLELGGRNPAFISSAANLPLAARRLLWGKTINAGQVCISHNYVLVERRIVDDFIKCINAVNKEFFPKGAKDSQEYARIINERQFDRIKKMLDDTNGKIVMGGETDRDDLYIAPTVVLVNSADDPMIQQESFGPIWAILPYDTIDEAIKTANEVDPTPLSLMTFGSQAENEKSKLSKCL
jgi:beta-apo-4'-carotenal oxygenase